MSLDGKISGGAGELHLSSQEDWMRVHELRNTVDAILVGAGTIIADNPQLTVRHKPQPNPLLRVVFDSQLSSPPDSMVFHDQDKFQTIIFTVEGRSDLDKIEVLRERGVAVIVQPKHEHSLEMQAAEGQRVDIPLALTHLETQHGVKRLLLEGGATLSSAFLNQGLINQGRIYVAPKFVGTGDSVPIVRLLSSDPTSSGLHVTIQDVTRLSEGFLLTIVPSAQ